jgi:hypothetical protein
MLLASWALTPHLGHCEQAAGLGMNQESKMKITIDDLAVLLAIPQPSRLADIVQGGVVLEAGN